MGLHYAYADPAQPPTTAREELDDLENDLDDDLSVRDVELFFAHGQVFPFRPRIFSHALGRGARREAACTHGSSLGPGRGP